MNLNPEVLHSLGRAGASEAYARVVAAEDPAASVNFAREFAVASYEAAGGVRRPNESSELRYLWDGDIRRAYDAASTDLAILMESVFSDAELGLSAEDNVRYETEMV